MSAEAPDPDSPVLPNFLLLGAKKCGTTALFVMLSQHPDVFFPRKEIHFFTHEGSPPPQPHVVTDFDVYTSLFAQARTIRIRGDASPSYLSAPGAAERIRKRLRSVKLMAILRHPVDRIYSDYMHERMSGKETCPTLAAALKTDENGQRFEYIRKTMYSQHVQRYFDLFDRKDILITLYDDFETEPRSFVRDVFSFLEIDPSVPIDTTIRTRASGELRNRTLHTVLSRTHRAKRAVRSVVPLVFYRQLARSVQSWNIARPELEPETRLRLLEEFGDEVDRLERMLGRDLTAWRT